MSAQKGEAIRGSICAEPDQLDHRLIYADWLEDHASTDLDTAQAELIRVQIARESADTAGLEYWTLRARERNLISRWGDDLAGELRHLEDHRFRRGFVEAVALTTEQLRQDAGAMRQFAPVRAIALSGQAENLTPDLLQPHDVLRVWSVLWMVADPHRQRELAEACRLRLFDANAGWLTFLLALFDLNHPLEHLGFGSTRLPVAGNLPELLEFAENDLQPILDRPWPTTLRSMDLRGANLPPERFRQLLAHSGMRTIDRLYLWAREGDSPLDDLAEEPNLAGLRSLWLGGNDIARSPSVGSSLTGLRRLVIQGEMSLSRARYVRSFGLSALETLRLEYPGTIAGLIDRLGDEPSWPNLRVLELARWQHNAVQEIVALLYSEVLPQLRRLELPTVPRNTLERRPYELALAELSLSQSTALGDITRATALTNLTTLEIADTRVEHPTDLDRLLDRDRFPRLLRVHLGGFTPSRTDRQRLEARFGSGFIGSSMPLSVFVVHDRILER